MAELLARYQWLIFRRATLLMIIVVIMCWARPHPLYIV